MKKILYSILSIFAVLLLWSCSTQKNTKANRFYHAFNSRYNIYFNGKTSFDESLAAMQNGYKESYSDMIYMFPISAQPKEKATVGGPFDRAIEKSNKAIKLHSIKTKPAKKPGWKNDPKQRKLQEQEEYNPFLKKCWLMMGQAQFYNADFLQASSTFSYIARHYATDEEMVAEARLWQARCYNEMGWFYESDDILHKLNVDGIPAKKMNLYSTFYADYLVKNKQLEDAVPYLKTAIKAEKNKHQRARMKYLLGQIYSDIDQGGLAYKSFGEVIKSNPPYALEFASRIRQTEVFTGANYQKVVKMLKSMAKNPKNKEMLDQVYYALGNVYLSRMDTINAIANYQTGIEKSVRGGLDKAICQIKLGDIYFQRRDYVKAQPCFSGALSGINKEYKDYKRVSKLSSVLDELVVHVEAVHLQDSLQTLAKMPEAEKLAVIDKIIEQVKKEEKEQKEQAAKDAYLAQQEAKGTGIDRPGTETGGITIPTIGGEGSFYFYNPQTVAQGKTAFQRKWGRRPLEDNWRRRKKEMSTFSDSPMAANQPDEQPEPAPGKEDIEEGLEPVAADDPKSREYYLQQLPSTPEDVAASDLIIEDGLYNMAMIYKDKLEDMPLALEAFAELERRFPGHKHLLESYYQCYLMGLRLQDAAVQAQYKSKLTGKFPKEDYTIAISDPNYEHNIRMMDKVQDSLYQSTYDRYLAGDVSSVRENYQEVGNKYPLAKLMPKFMFLDALTYVQQGDAEGFKATLKALIEKYPNADVSSLAGEMLKGMLRGRQLMQGGISGMKWNLRFGLGEGGELSAADSARTFGAEPNVPYRMMLMFPTGTIEKNKLLFVVAAYNFSNFMVKEIDLSFEEGGPMTSLMLKGFYSLGEVLHYYKMIYGDTGYASELGKHAVILPISDDNYETLMHGKTLDEYVSFFEENFGKAIPEVGTRWRKFMEADKISEEEAQDEAPTLEEPTIPVLRDEEITPPAVAPEAAPVKEQQPVEHELQPESLPAVKADSLKPAEQSTPIIVAPVEQPKKLTLKDIEEIRKQQAAQEAAKKEDARRAFEAEQEAQRQLQQQKAEENAPIIEQQQVRDEAVLQTKAEREKAQQAEKKAKLKQQDADRKAKLKAREELRKQKEREYKERLKAKEKEMKQKEREYEEKAKAREKERARQQKEKEAAMKSRKR